MTANHSTDPGMSHERGGRKAWLVPPLLSGKKKKKEKEKENAWKSIAFGLDDASLHLSRCAARKNATDAESCNRCCFPIFRCETQGPPVHRTLQQQECPPRALGRIDVPSNFGAPAQYEQEREKKKNSLQSNVFLANRPSEAAFRDVSASGPLHGS